MDQQQPTSSEITFDIQKLLVFCKRHHVALLLLAFMIFGFYLRSYHIDFPVIGYHNMKESQYIPYTEFMYNAAEFLDYFRTETYLAGSQQRGYFTQYEFPLLPWLILPLWWIFGIELWAARLLIIFFSLACIPLLYFVSRQLTDNKPLALVASFFFTIMPISIFFGRNVQPEMPALFFILLGTYCFLRWRDAVLAHVFAYTFFTSFSLSFLIAILLKIPNGIGLVPLLFFVPWKTLFSHKKYFFKIALLFLLLMAIFPLWVKFSQFAMPGATTVGTSGFHESFAEVRTNISLTFSSSYWKEYYPGIRSFVLDNFTLWFFWLSVLGLFFGFLKHKTKIGLFLLGSLFSLLLYILFFADKFRGHAYYQVVFLPFVCLASAYALFVVAGIFESFLKNNPYQKYIDGNIFFVLFVLILFFSFTDLTSATNRVFDVIYYGQDIAGEFISKNSDPDDRIFIDGVFAQSSGLLWHAHRYGLDEISSNLTWFKEMEETLQFRWVVLYGPGIGTVQSKPAVWEYIQQTYQIRQLGLVPHQDGLAPYYFVLEKGGVFDIDGFAANKTPYLVKTYTNTAGTFDFYAMDDSFALLNIGEDPGGSS